MAEGQQQRRFAIAIAIAGHATHPSGDIRRVVKVISF